MKTGKFIISLDFEIHWGGFEKWDINRKKKYFLNSRNSIPSVLKLFEENDIEATWATVGFLFAKNKKQLESLSPKQKPTYLNKKLSYYNYFSQIGLNEIDDPFHYAGDIIRLIIKTKGQELACHTYSHYYCNEEGQTIQQFDEDLKSAQIISKKNFNVDLKSLVFPRNQINKDYLDIVINNGFKVVRSNPNVWFWQNTNGVFSRIFRAIDTLISISSSLCFGKILKYKTLDILPASRFFRPYKKTENLIQNLKIKRIKKEMYFAAKNNLNYHLWWHPHNFGEDIDKNMEQLENIIQYYKYLNSRFNFISKNMINLQNE